MARNSRAKAESSSVQNSAARTALLYQSNHFSYPTSYGNRGHQHPITGTVSTGGHITFQPFQLANSLSSNEYKSCDRLDTPEVPTETKVAFAGKTKACRKRKGGQLKNHNECVGKKFCLGEGKRFSVSAFGFPTMKSMVGVNDIDKRFLSSKVNVKLHQRNPTQYKTAPKHSRLDPIEPITSTSKFSIIPKHRLAKTDKSKYTRSSLHKDWKKQLQKRRHGQWIPSGHVSGRWKPPQWAVKSECIPMQTKVASCKKSLLPRLDNLVLTFIENAEIKLGPSCERVSRRSASLCGVKCPSYTKPTVELLRHAHIALQNLLPRGDCEEWEVIELARKYYQYWKPKETRIILLAESHAHTTTVSANYIWMGLSCVFSL